MHQKKTSKYTKDQIYNSLILPNSYFNTALILADYIKKNITKYGGSYQLQKKYQDSIHEMFNPLIYNLKHGIELSCKTILNLGNDKFDEGHDIKENYTKFKTMYFKLIEDGFIILETEEKEELDKIDSIIENIYNRDIKNTEHRYPNTQSFLIQRASKKTRKAIKPNGKSQVIEWEIKDPSKGVYKEKFLLHTSEFSRMIPNICNNDKSLWEDKFVCIQKIEDIITQLRNFFEKIGKKEYFRKKIVQKI